MAVLMLLLNWNKETKKLQKNISTLMLRQGIVCMESIRGLVIKIEITPKIGFATKISPADKPALSVDSYQHWCNDVHFAVIL